MEKAYLDEALDEISHQESEKTLMNESEVTINKVELSQEIKSELTEKAVMNVRNLRETSKKEEEVIAKEVKQKRPRTRKKEDEQAGRGKIRNLELLAAKFNQGVSGPRIAKHSRY